MPIRVYLAGPDVFLPHAACRASAQKVICARHGLEGVSPLDPVPSEPAEWRGRSAAARIALCNEAHIRRCTAVIANLTPFRGPSADPGTVYEVGFARALGRPVFAYAGNAMHYAERVRLLHPGVRDADGMEIEDFALFENLMVACAIEESGGILVAEDRQGWTDLTLFERCVQQAASKLVRQDEQVG